MFKKLMICALYTLVGLSVLPCHSMKITPNTIATFAVAGTTLLPILVADNLGLSTYIHELGHALTFKALFDGNCRIMMSNSSSIIPNFASAMTTYQTNERLEGIRYALVGLTGPLTGATTAYLIARAELSLLSLLPLSNSNPIKAGLKYAIIGATAIFMFDEIKNLYPRNDHNDGGQILAALGWNKKKNVIN